MTSHSDTKSDPGSPGGPTRNDVNRSSFQITPIIAAIITGLCGVIGVCITVIFGPLILCKLLPHTCEVSTPAILSTPTLSLTSALVPSPTFSINSVLNADFTPVHKDYAPHNVIIRGSVSNAKGYYLYLIVVDAGGVKWIQPPVGWISEDQFSFTGSCYLGDSKAPLAAQNKPFIIYAAISEYDKYKENDHPSDQSILALSEPIYLMRRDLPTPTP